MPNLTITDHDEGDGPLLGCTECKETTGALWGPTETYLLYALYCRECLCEFLRKDDLRPVRKRSAA